MLGLATTVAVFLVVAARPTNAFSSCDVQRARTGYFDWNTTGTINDVNFEERPAYMYVDWGDGSSPYYQESQGTGTKAFVALHTYVPGTYFEYYEIGTIGNGVCDSGEFFVLQQQ
jgi:hypothetical protein